jgi:hypothetical protein
MSPISVFGAQRFYYVFTGVPGWDKGSRPSEEDVAKLKRDKEAYDKNHVSLTVRIDDEGKVTPVVSQEDFQRGLLKITTAGEAQSAAAAVLSLLNTGEVCPAPLAAEKIKVDKTGDGAAARWVCRISSYLAVFDAEGRLAQVPNKHRPPRR